MPSKKMIESNRRKLRPHQRVVPAGETLADTTETGQLEAHSAVPADPLRVRSKVWVEAADGRVVISEFRADLLDAVDAHGSVAEAARAIGLPYRTAWKKLDEMETALGTTLIETESGGRAGGGTQLTEAARSMLKAYRRLSEPLAEEVRDRFEAERAHFS
jgi:molybdate transport system regulatory protein